MVHPYNETLLFNSKGGSSHEKKLKCMLLSEKADLEGYICCESNYMTFWKSQNFADSKNIKLGEPRIFRAAELLHNGGYMSLDVYPNPHNVEHQEQIPA